MKLQNKVSEVIDSELLEHLVLYVMTTDRAFLTAYTRRIINKSNFSLHACRESIEIKTPGICWWLSELKIWHCRCSGSGQYCGMSSVPGPRTSACHENDKKKKKKILVNLYCQEDSRDSNQNYPEHSFMLTRCQI